MQNMQYKSWTHRVDTVPCTGLSFADATFVELETSHRNMVNQQYTSQRIRSLYNNKNETFAFKSIKYSQQTQ